MRLIDADALLIALLHDLEFFETVSANGDVLIRISDVAKIIERQPVAFSKSKVIEQLKDKQKEILEIIRFGGMK